MLPETIREAARRFGERTAYVIEPPGGTWRDGFELTYADVDRLSDEHAAGLVRRGVRPGDRVALVVPPGAEYLVGYLGAAKAGAITTGVNDRLSAAEREAVLDRAQPALVLTAPGFGSDRFECLEVAPSASADDVLREIRVRGADAPAVAIDDDADVAIIFTSGTTGAPKGARYGNRQLRCITQTDIGDAWDLGGRTSSGTSFAHLGFMTKLPGALRRGGVTYVQKRWRAADALALTAEQRMTTLAGVPTQLALMLRDPSFDDLDLSSVAFVILGGGPVTPGLAEEARRRIGAKLATRYSCTEAGIGLGTAFDAPEEDAVVSVGRPHPVVTLGLRHAADPDRTDDVAVGEVGEVCLRSPACMHGYWDDPAATAAAFTPDGFVRTGDLGYLDEQGRVRLVGRNKEMYVRGGYNVYPVEVEAALSLHPGVAAAAVVPEPDPVMGERGVAVIVPAIADQPPTLRDVREFLAHHVAAYKLPENLQVVDALPLTAMDKLDRTALRAMLQTAPTR
ncbi:MAG TPA: class I adenylate-forming enzyme family protein [Acidimicrobiia bacterium]